MASEYNDPRMTKLISASDFGKPDPYFREGTRTNRSLADRLGQLRTKVESIQLSPYLHPEVEEYIYRVLNVFLHGWFYYPLFKVAETLSKLNLEQALKLRFQFQSGQRTSLKGLLNRASRSGVLPFEQTEAVKRIFKARKEQETIYEALGLPNIKGTDIKEIARNREKMILENLPALRAFDVHPTMASVTLPNHALIGIKQNIDYINIIYENSDTELRSLLRGVDFDWNQVSYLPVDSNEDGFSKPLLFPNRESIQLSEVSQYIDEVALFLGLEKRKTANQLWILNKFTLLPTKPFEKLMKIFRRKEEKRPTEFTCKEDLEDIERIESNCTALLQRFSPRFSLRTQGVELHFELMKPGKVKKKWRVSTMNESGRRICFVKSNELSYYLLLKLSLWSHQENNLRWHSRLLKKLISGMD